MKKNISLGFSIFAVIIIVWGIITRNELIENEETVKGKWSDVENQYQRRADLIPNLVNLVKGYAAHEKTTFEEIAQARSQASQLTIHVENLNKDNLDNYGKTQEYIGIALGKLLVITENYPELRANQNFLELQAQLEGTENRIAVERSRYNKAVNIYNTTKRLFPKSLIASLFGFENMPYYEAEKGSDKANITDF